MQKRHSLVEEGAVSSRADVVRDHQRQPEKIVGKARAHPTTRGRMPPVLHVAFLELPAGGAQDLCPLLCWGAVCQRHDVLELIAEAIGTARLIEGRPAPNPAA